MEFTFGPRHRVVTRTARFPWVRMLLSTIVGVMLGLMLLVAGGILTPAHAGNMTPEQMKFYAEKANTICRDSPHRTDACNLRDELMRLLKSRDVCWNARAATPEALWQSCSTPPKTKPQMMVDAELGRCAKVARDADTVTRLRDTMVPRQHVIASGFPAPLVESIYSGRVSSYRGAAYCYSAENILNVRAALGVS